MTHNIYEEMFLSTRQPAWHKLGIQVPLGTKAVDGLAQINADYQIEKYPVQVQLPGMDAPTIDPKHFAIVRHPAGNDPEYAVLGYAGEDYQILQNRDIAQRVDLLTDTWPLETIGVLRDGATVFFVLGAGEYDIAGKDPMKNYFMVDDTRDGGTALKIAFTPVLTVCQNTETAALAQATAKINITHGQRLVQDVDLRLSLVKALSSTQQAVTASFERMAKAILTDDIVDAVLAQVYPYPVRPKKAMILDEVWTEEEIEAVRAVYDEALGKQSEYEYYVNRQQGFRDLAKQLFARNNDTKPWCVGSAWNLYNAVTESADHRRGSDGVPLSSLFGERAREKQRAYSAVLNAIGG